MKKKSLKKILIVTIPLLIVSLTAYLHNINEDRATMVDQTQNNIFVCPMHPEAISNQPGKCPVCGMDLEEKSTPESQKMKSTGKSGKTDQKPDTYVCSMHPDIIRTSPGNCPVCGMALIEKTTVDNNMMDNNLDLISRPVNKSIIASVQTISPNNVVHPLIVDATGIINFDPHRVRTICAKFPGLIEKSYVKFTYQSIRKGQKIYDIYCPEIYNDHWNYVNIIKTFPDKHDLNREAMEWFLKTGLTNEQIQELISSERPNFHLTVCSDFEGFAVGANFNADEKSLFGENSELSNNPFGLNDGSVVETGSPLFKVVDTEIVRADLKIRTEDAGLLKIGQKVILTDDFSGGKPINSIISQIEPLNGGLFQLVKVYVTNKEKIFLPGSQIHAQILAGTSNNLWAPRSSIINLGQKQMVFLLKDSVFVATVIKTGLQSDKQIEIISGIDSQSRIAFNASLLIDSDGFIKSN